MSEPETKQPNPPDPQIELVDGDRITPLSAEAIAVALFACGFVIARDPAGKILDVALDRGKVAALATQVQGMLARGETIKLQMNRVLRAEGNGVVGA